MSLRMKRIYDPASAEDGKRVLVDRLWPRGISKEKAQIDEWMKDIAPNPELRKWFSHKEERFEEFRKLYEQELAFDPLHRKMVEHIKHMSKTEEVTLIYAAKDQVNNHCIVLYEWIERE